MTATSPPRRRILGALGALALALAGLAATSAVPAAAATSTLSATSLTTTAGSTGGQPVSVLAVKDQSGTQNNWNKYVELTGAYAGYARYQLPSGTTGASLTGLSLTANFLGPDTRTQTWTWSAYDWTTSTWVALGTNPSTGGWSTWKQVTWNATGTTSRFASSTGEVRVQVKANNAADAMDIDYQVVTVTTGAGGGGGGGGGTTRWVPQQADRWVYQLGNPTPNTSLCSVPSTGGPCVRPTVWAIDLYDASGSTPNASGVTAVHNAGGKAVCYVSAGTWEDWRPDASAFPASVKAGGVQGGPNGQPWPGEKWLDIRQVSTLQPLMQARAQKCKNAGFDAIDWDNVDAYTNVTGLTLTGAQQVTYNRMLATITHDLGLSVGLKNDLEQVTQLVGDFDFAVNEQCFANSNECSLLNPFLSAGKAVVQIEYSDEDGTTTGQFCPPANAAGRSAILMTIDLPATPWTPCR